MGKSKAKRLRDKQTREGKRNPESNRSPFSFYDLRTRRTKTKKDYMYRKKKKNHDSDDGGGFFCALKTMEILVN
ncbi:hypothetical protein [Alkalihalobacillus sp. LMS39]|uniref:hypothetical protein n=1 Tax=Alkalihalobacillus sp. LMS39 TaxID=2924032 RepID=UPI001FB1C717|nr:hypothetical protein [Alkalihalobacillus sp. LMS39]UOE92515.1 hypothetical protein MM271_14850 [Alkalihalobacillus sp. LMS39]